MNISKCVDKDHEGKSFAEIVKLPPSALQGLSEKADTLFAEYNIKTIKDMANWKFFNMAVAIAELAKTETKNGREEGSKQNLNKILDKKHEKSSLKELLKLPISAFSGLTESADEHFKPLGAFGNSIGELAKGKYFKWAVALTTFADYESADFSS